MKVKRTRKTTHTKDTNECDSNESCARRSLIVSGKRKGLGARENANNPEMAKWMLLVSYDLAYLVRRN